MKKLFFRLFKGQFHADAELQPVAELYLAVAGSAEKIYVAGADFVIY